MERKEVERREVERRGGEEERRKGGGKKEEDNNTWNDIQLSYMHTYPSCIYPYSQPSPPLIFDIIQKNWKREKARNEVNSDLSTHLHTSHTHTHSTPPRSPQLRRALQWLHSFSHIPSSRNHDKYCS